MIEVLKQMIEALEWCHGGEPVGTADAIKAGKKLIAELEIQEPVAWKHPDKDMVFWEDTKEVDEYHGFKPTIPLYTHPPQRTVLQLKEIDRPESASVGDYNRGWNDCLFASGIVKQSQRPRIVFPTMLRKMWSGGEVQAWLDENVNKEKNT